MHILHIGFGSVVNEERVICILSAESAPVKRMIADAREGGRLVDATFGRKTRSILVMDSGHICLSALQAGTISDRASASEKMNTVGWTEEAENCESDISETEASEESDQAEKFTEVGKSPVAEKSAAV